jgi:hypothetical protein
MAFATTAPVPVLYASHRVIERSTDGDASDPDARTAASRSLTLDSFASAVDDEPTCAKLLRASAEGKQHEVRPLAIKLAIEVLALPIIALAHEVLAGRGDADGKAIELAQRLVRVLYASQRTHENVNSVNRCAISDIART